MSELASLCERLSGSWWSCVIQTGWQSAAVGLLLIGVVRLGHRWPSPVRYGLLVLALMKFAMPPLAIAPIAILNPWPASEPIGVFHEFSTLATAPDRPTSPSSAPVGEVGVPLAQASQAAPMPGESRILRLGSWLMLLHVTGFVCIMAWLAGQSLRMRRMLHAARPVSDDRVVEQFELLCRELDVHRKPRLVSVPLNCSPFSFGLLRPAVVLPQSICDCLSADDLRAILAHELAHHRRRDLWINALQTVLCAAWWFHPVIWLVNGALRAVREDCCDDLLLARSWATGDGYCGVLLRVAKNRACHASAALTLAMSTGTERLGRRFRRIMDNTIRRSARLSPVGLGILVLIAACLLPNIRGVHEEGAAMAGVTRPNSSNELAHEATTRPFQGKVIDEAGKPVADAEICIPVSLPERHVLSARSDSRGVFTVRVPLSWFPKTPLRDVTVVVWAYAKGHQLGNNTIRDWDGASDPKVAIQLQTATDTDSGLVVLDPQGQPRAEALVEPLAFNMSGMFFSRVPEELLPRIATRTDSQGRVRLPAISRGKLVEVRVTTDDLGIQNWWLRHPGTKGIVRYQPTVRLAPAGKIEGRIIADRPESVRRVRLTFTTNDFPYKGLPHDGTAETVSDDQGRFVVPVIALGKLTTDVHVANDELRFRRNSGRLQEVKAGETTRVEIPLAPTVTVRGSVMDIDAGEPVPAQISIVGTTAGLFSALTDAQGQFTVRLLPGRYSVRVASRDPRKIVGGSPKIKIPGRRAYYQLGCGPGPEGQKFDVPDRVKEVDWPVIQLASMKDIAGRVIDQNSKPVAWANIVVIEGIARYGHLQCISDANGQFTARIPAVIDPAKANFKVNARTSPPYGLFNQATETAAEVVQADPLVIRARVEKQEGQPQGPPRMGISGTLF